MPVAKYRRRRVAISKFIFIYDAINNVPYIDNKKIIKTMFTILTL